MLLRNQELWSELTELPQAHEGLRDEIRDLLSTSRCSYTSLSTCYVSKFRHAHPKDS